MQIGKTEKIKVPRGKTIVYNDRKNYYDMKRYVREMRGVEIIVKWLQANRSYHLPEPQAKYYRYLSLLVEKGGFECQ